ncbi:MAG: ATP-binding protein [Candidatus Pacebacteria bacterium]|nr:ATP-binding protein [Candidatus Paceibacterota bacterium]
MNYEKIIIKWKEFQIPEVLKRLINLDLNHDFITTITGPRRAGKTYFCFQIIISLLEKGISKENILYINFEDEKLLNANANDLDNLFEKYLEFSEINNKQNIFLFLDEIQNVANWDSWIRRISDTEKNIKLILTGSSSKLLSKEISTKLRGRSLNTEVYPLSFEEHLKWKNIDYNLKTIIHSKDKIAVKKAFSLYLFEGGYPALSVNKKLPREQVLQGYYQSMLFKDIVERYKIKEVKKLKILIKLLFESVTKEISYNKLANKLKSLGFKISKNTIIEYISHLEDAYLFFENIKYEYSITKQLGSIKKIYCIDNGLLNATSFKFSDDRGKLMENLVFIELKRRKKEVYFYSDKNECDFLIKEKNKITSAIQVSEKIEDNNDKREINGLISALEKYDLKEGMVLSLDDEKKQEIIKKKKIKFIPIWKWLLER